MTLHSILDIFQYKGSNGNISWLCLYIPFWIYSNTSRLAFYLTVDLPLHSILDIFQSSRLAFYLAVVLPLHSILDIFQLKVFGKEKAEKMFFTFHSGYIPIQVGLLNYHNLTTLHSILDIFQYPIFLSASLISVDFTFHSGYIPIHSLYNSLE